MLSRTEIVNSFVSDHLQFEKMAENNARNSLLVPVFNLPQFLTKLIRNRI